jgi:hypothetical protein
MKRPTGRQALVIFLTSVVLGHVFISAGRNDMLLQVFAEAWYYSDLFFISMINFCVIVYVCVVHFALDERTPLRTATTKRLTFQMLLAVLLPATIVCLIAIVYMYFVLGLDIRYTSFFVYEFPLAVAIIISANLVFMVLSLRQRA